MSVCYSCGGIFRFTEDMNRQELTDSEIDELKLRQPEVMRLVGKMSAQFKQEAAIRAGRAAAGRN